jgi:hypothetical protein
VNKVDYEFVAHFRGTSVNKVSLLLSMLIFPVVVAYSVQLQVEGGSHKQ